MCHVWMRCLNFLSSSPGLPLRAAVGARTLAVLGLKFCGVDSAVHASRPKISLTVSTAEINQTFFVALVVIHSLQIIPRARSAQSSNGICISSSSSHMQSCISRVVQSINEGAVIASEKSNHRPGRLYDRVLERTALPLNQSSCIEAVAPAAGSSCAVQRTAARCYTQREELVGKG
jgi:hypothetical protein